MPIPKSINQIWLQGKENIPEKYLKNIESIKAHNPTWSYKLWDEKSIREVVASLGSQYLKKYDSYTLLHNRVDFGRYAILYKLGGVFADIDAFAHKGFDSTPYLNEKDFIVSKNSTNAFINNAFIASSKNNPLLKGLLDYILTLECNPLQAEFQCIQSTTGPLTFTKYLNQHLDQVTVLANKYFEPCSGRNPYCVINQQDTILDHIHSASWLPNHIKKGMEFRYFCREYKWVIILLVVIILILLFKKHL